MLKLSLFSLNAVNVLLFQLLERVTQRKRNDSSTAGSSSVPSHCLFLSMVGLKECLTSDLLRQETSDTGSQLSIVAHLKWKYLSSSACTKNTADSDSLVSLWPLRFKNMFTCVLLGPASSVCAAWEEFHLRLCANMCVIYRYIVVKHAGVNSCVCLQPPRDLRGDTRFVCNNGRSYFMSQVQICR